MSKIDQDGRGPRAVSRGFIRMGHHLRQLSVASLGGVGGGGGNESMKEKGVLSVRLLCAEERGRPCPGLAG